MKKMTSKEFKEAVNKVGLDFKVCGYEGILNALASGFRTQSREYDTKELKALSDMYLDMANKIYDILDARGYYDDCK